jgi:hypothetical protein
MAEIIIIFKLFFKLVYPILKVFKAYESDYTSHEDQWDTLSFLKTLELKKKKKKDKCKMNPCGLPKLQCGIRSNSKILEVGQYNNFVPVVKFRLNT